MCTRVCVRVYACARMCVRVSVHVCTCVWHFKNGGVKPCVRGRHPRNHQIRETDFATIHYHLHHTPWTSRAAPQLGTILAAKSHMQQQIVPCRAAYRSQTTFRCLSAGVYHSQRAFWRLLAGNDLIARGLLVPVCCLVLEPWKLPTVCMYCGQLSRLKVCT